MRKMFGFSTQGKHSAKPRTKWYLTEKARDTAMTTAERKNNELPYSWRDTIAKVTR